MSTLEERLTATIVAKGSDGKALATAASIVFFATFTVSTFLRLWQFMAAGLAISAITLVASMRRPPGVRFLADGIEELGRGKTPVFTAYVDINHVERVGDEVVVETGGRSLWLGLEGSREPGVPDIITELTAHLEANVAEAHALSAAREEVVAFLARGVPTSDDAYRSFPAPRAELEAVARSRVMPARLRVAAARALGDDASEELVEEASNASEIERRRV